MYRDAFQAEFNVNVDHSWTNQLSKGKWSKRMAAVFQASGVRWTETVEMQAKAVVARTVAERPESAIRSGCEGVIDALRNALETKLDARRS